MYNYEMPLAATLKALGVSTLSTLCDRNIMQREIYLLESVGYPLKFGFYWSLHSVYSEDLMDEASGIVGCLDALPSEAQLKKPYMTIVELLKELEEKAEKYGHPLLKWLDLLVSTVHNVVIDDDAKKEYTVFKKKSASLLKKVEKSKDGNAVSCHI